MSDLYRKNSYFYNLPKELIAQYPLKERAESRLMVINRENQSISHHHFYDIGDFINSGDVLVVNNTKVIPARLYAKKENGTPIEVFLLHKLQSNIWKCLVHPGKKLKKAQLLSFAHDLSGFISQADKEGLRDIEFICQGDVSVLLNKYGHVPLPPYIERNDEDKDTETYQTVYAKENGSVAAPTAGFHFTEDIMSALKNKGVIIVEVLLHVGLGTFRPVKVDDIRQHKMHSEFCSINKETASIINQAKKQGRRIFAVGTTSLRTLESFAVDGRLMYGEKWTDKFIHPGIKIHMVDCLLTNFHLPESTLLMLVTAFAGYNLTICAYDVAVQDKYRFFSYGDAMLIQ
ncbi:MAG: tRNA preQ1(34) S-adenosylmethionine ribosyltransferase-isomerase QueA [Candidatus Cloacimonetes bacterium]|nr:tRNA preQ1(34) S-adenosylmethionine ribosyltransferase-isomerase QueA [Candidatus Cloacimonadota bacterium]